jgi:hypothetical protein
MTVSSAMTEHSDERQHKEQRDEEQVPAADQEHQRRE